MGKSRRKASKKGKKAPRSRSSKPKNQYRAKGHNNTKNLWKPWLDLILQESTDPSTAIEYPEEAESGMIDTVIVPTYLERYPQWNQLNNTTLLHLACYSGAITAIRILLRSKFNPTLFCEMNIGTHEKPMTAYDLIFAKHSGKRLHEILSSLLDFQIGPDIPSGQYNLLHSACSREDKSPEGLAAISPLLEAGISPFIKIESEDSLHFNQFSAIELLYTSTTDHHSKAFIGTVLRMLILSPKQVPTEPLRYFGDLLQMVIECGGPLSLVRNLLQHDFQPTLKKAPLLKPGASINAFDCCITSQAIATPEHRIALFELLSEKSQLAKNTGELQNLLCSAITWNCPAIYKHVLKKYDFPVAPPIVNLYEFLMLIHRKQPIKFDIIQAFNALINSGRCPLVHGTSGGFPNLLFPAVSCWNVDLLGWLLDQGLDPNAVYNEDSASFTFFEFILYQDNVREIDKIELLDLVHSKIDKLYLGPCLGKDNMLQYAIEQGMWSIMCYLLKRGFPHDPSFPFLISNSLAPAGEHKFAIRAYIMCLDNQIPDVNGDIEDLPAIFYSTLTQTKIDVSQLENYAKSLSKILYERQYQFLFHFKIGALQDFVCANIADYDLETDSDTSHLDIFLLRNLLDRLQFDFFAVLLPEHTSEIIDLSPDISNMYLDEALVYLYYLYHGTQLQPEDHVTLLNEIHLALAQLKPTKKALPSIPAKNTELALTPPPAQSRLDYTEIQAYRIAQLLIHEADNPLFDDYLEGPDDIPKEVLDVNIAPFLQHYSIYHDLEECNLIHLAFYLRCVYGINKLLDISNDPYKIAIHTGEKENTTVNCFLLLYELSPNHDHIHYLLPFFKRCDILPGKFNLLHAACANLDVETIQWCIENGYSPDETITENTINCIGHNAYSLIVLSNFPAPEDSIKTACFNALIHPDKGVPRRSIHLGRKQSHINLLHLCIEHSQYALVNRLLELGFDPLEHPDRTSPLASSERPTYDAVARLIISNAIIDEQARCSMFRTLADFILVKNDGVLLENNTPFGNYLHLAVIYLRYDLIKIMISEYNFNPLQPTKKNDVAISNLHLSLHDKKADPLLSLNVFLFFLELFKERDFDVKKILHGQCFEFPNFLYKAIDGGHLPLIECLLDYDFNPEDRLYTETSIVIKIAGEPIVIGKNIFEFLLIRDQLTQSQIISIYQLLSEKYGHYTKRCLHHPNLLSGALSAGSFEFAAYLRAIGMAPTPNFLSLITQATESKTLQITATQAYLAAQSSSSALPGETPDNIRQLTDRHSHLQPICLLAGLLTLDSKKPQGRGSQRKLRLLKSQLDKRSTALSEKINEGAALFSHYYKIFSLALAMSYSYKAPSSFGSSPSTIFGTDPCSAFGQPSTSTLSSTPSSILTASKSKIFGDKSLPTFASTTTQLSKHQYATLLSLTYKHVCTTALESKYRTGYHPERPNKYSGEEFIVYAYFIFSGCRPNSNGRIDYRYRGVNNQSLIEGRLNTIKINMKLLHAIRLAMINSQYDGDQHIPSYAAYCVFITEIIARKYRQLNAYYDQKTSAVRSSEQIDELIVDLISHYCKNTERLDYLLKNFQQKDSLIIGLSLLIKVIGEKRLLVDKPYLKKPVIHEQLTQIVLTDIRSVQGLCQIVCGILNLSYPTANSGKILSQKQAHIIYELLLKQISPRAKQLTDLSKKQLCRGLYHLVTKLLACESKAEYISEIEESLPIIFAPTNKSVDAPSSSLNFKSH